jgi:hypothetical protein
MFAGLLGAHRVAPFADHAHSRCELVHGSIASAEKAQDDLNERLHKAQDDTRRQLREQVCWFPSTEFVCLEAALYRRSFLSRQCGRCCVCCACWTGAVAAWVVVLPDPACKSAAFLSPTRVVPSRSCLGDSHLVAVFILLTVQQAARITAERDRAEEQRREEEAKVRFALLVCFVSPCASLPATCRVCLD